MEKLAIMIREMYPARYFSIREQYNNDEVGNVYVEYVIWVNDVCSETFYDYKDLEEFVYDLANKSVIDEAKYIIKGRKE